MNICLYEHMIFTHNINKNNPVKNINFPDILT